ncbi:MAG TPA: MBL fold metallo-hydrolase [Longimicrobiales bacterium]|nr:MBL fold metallo-hydrolase [Longimicrobiales bacterium]
MACTHTRSEESAGIPIRHRDRKAGTAGSWDRRGFLRAAGGCAAHLAMAAAAAPLRVSSLFAATATARVTQEVPWGRLEEVSEGIWALVSTPLADPTTLCNGGIIRGHAGVIMVEAFGSPRGAAWMAEQARALTGRWPDQVLLTHYHGDHTGGLPGIFHGEGSDPTPRATAATRELTRGTARSREDAALLAALERVSVLPGVAPMELDLGGKVVEVRPLEGHTASDLVVEVRDPAVVFCGDLVWNRFFPNYVDAVPSLLTASVTALRRDAGVVYIPGHGPLAGAAELQIYLELLARVEEQARRAHASGLNASEAAREFTLPSPLDEWFLFSDGYPERALGAWLAELGAA